MRSRAVIARQQATAWSPASLGSKVMFWQSAKEDVAANRTLVGSKLSSWNDLSGLANHAAEATDADRPTWETDATTGFWKVTFAASKLVIPDHASLDPTLGAALYVACAPTAWLSYCRLVGKETGVWTTSWDMRFDSSVGCEWAINGAGTTVRAVGSIPTSGRHLFVGRYDKVNRTTRYDRAAANTNADTAAITGSANPVLFGVLTNTVSGNYWSGSMFEVVACNEDLTSGENTSLESYLHDTWQLA